MWVLLLTACRPPPPPTAPPAAAPLDPLEPRRTEFILDPGRIQDGEWVSTPPVDRLGDPPPLEGEAGEFSRFAALAPPGPGVARVDRHDCAPAQVPYRPGPDGGAIVLAYPACGPPDAVALPGTAVLLGRAEVTRCQLATMRVADPTTAIAYPGPDDLPAVWVSHAMAQAWCGWQGGRLPTRAEWAAAAALAPDARVSNGTRDRYGPGPQAAPASTTWSDLRGNVAEWLADGSVAGGSWVSGRDELGVERVPPEARSDTIGFRCAWD